MKKNSGMEKERLESLLIDYIDGKLATSDKVIVEKELAMSEEARQLYTQLKEVMEAMDRSAKLHPSTSLQRSFDKMLKQEMESANKSTKVVFFTPAFYRVAAAVLLLIVGGASGYLISKYQRQQQEIADIKRQVEETKNQMMAMITDDLSASQRIQGVNVAWKITKADDEVVNALVKAMNEDSNTNVRLAAVDALSKFYTDPKVRRELIDALGKQKDPIVQISLIQLLVKMKEKNVVEDLNKIVDDVQTIKPVKDEAYSAILKLS
jgi:anti-sigma-K factor RskA